MGRLTGTAAELFPISRRLGRSDLKALATTPRCALPVAPSERTAREPPLQVERLFGVAR